MTRERGQALVEAVIAMPVCLACAVTLVDCGVIVRDRIVVAQAATRAAEARLAGQDERVAARTALPATLRDSFALELRDDRVVVRVTSGARIAKLVGRSISHSSTVRTDAEVAR